MDKNDPFLSLDQKIGRIARNLFSPAWLTPVNPKQEQKKFFRLKGYNPNFCYKPFNPHPSEKALSLLKIPPDCPLTGLFQETKDFLAAYLQALKNRGLKNFTNPFLFGRPSPKLIQFAQSILQKPIKPSAERKRYSAPDLKKHFLKLLADLKIKEWKIKINSQMVARAAVNPETKTISFKKGEKFSLKDFKKLQAHEIETHLFRSLNGRLQPYKIFATQAIPGYLPTEEGLALFNEEKAGVLSPPWLRIYAGRVVAVNQALYCSFREIYASLLEFFSPQQAFQITLGAKRGLGDTASPGGFIKDHLYLQGKMLIENYVKKGGKIKPLYAGKIGLQHLWLLKKGILKPPKYLPEYLRRGLLTPPG